MVRAWRNVEEDLTTLESLEESTAFSDQIKPMLALARDLKIVERGYRHMDRFWLSKRELAQSSRPPFTWRDVLITADAALRYLARRDKVWRPVKSQSAVWSKRLDLHRLCDGRATNETKDTYTTVVRGFALILVHTDLELQREANAGADNNAAHVLHEKIQVLLDSAELCYEGMHIWLAMTQPYAAADVDLIATQLPRCSTPLRGVQIGLDLLASTNQSLCRHERKPWEKLIGYLRSLSCTGGSGTVLSPDAMPKRPATPPPPPFSHVAVRDIHPLVTLQQYQWLRSYVPELPNLLEFSSEGPFGSAPESDRVLVARILLLVAASGGDEPTDAAFMQEELLIDGPVEEALFGAWSMDGLSPMSWSAESLEDPNEGGTEQSMPSAA